ncbi:UNVERIFIED_CONTAM: hypothetical protein FKN15_020825 [Acipenser sinensis]
MLNCRLERDPWLFLLGLMSGTIGLTSGQLKLMTKLLFVARKCILINWIKDNPPTTNQWYTEMFKILPLERLSAVVKGDEESFLSIWHPFLDLLPNDLANIIENGQVLLR